MSDALHVLLEGRPLGILERTSNGRLRLTYEAGYAGTPLSVSMPTAMAVHSDARVRPWFEGLLPDDEAVRARWARQFRVGTSTFSLLGTPVGEDCAGAVQVVPEARAAAMMERPGEVRWLTSAELAHRLRTLRRDGTTWLGTGGAGRFSLAGAQAKTALFTDGRRWGVPTGAHPTSHILKPAIPGFDDHEVNEHLCLDAARRLGIRAARSHLLHVEGQAAVVVERFDRRTRPDGRLQRIHQEDLCQALAVPPSQKCEADGGPGPAAVIAVLRAVMGDAAGTDAVERFTAALAFNWLIGGTDAHAKNYGLLLSADQVRLAPLYDLASALVYPGVHERRLQMAMKVGRGYGLWPRSDPWPRAAAAWGVDAGDLRERVLAMSEALPDALRDAAATPAVAALDSPLPARLLDRVAARAARCRSVMEAPRRG